MPRADRLHQYEEIAQDLRLQILRGDFQKVGRLPSERSLGVQFGVQRNTIRQALELLEREGRISTEGKRGSFILPTSINSAGRTLLISLHGGSSPDLIQLVDGFSRVASVAGFTVRRQDTQPVAGEAFDLIPRAETLPEDVAGVVLWPQNPTDAEALSRLNALVPLVLIDRRTLGVSSDSVRFDDVEGGRAVTQHLIDQGHRKIGYITDDGFVETVQNRWHGYALALEQNHVPIDPQLTLFFNGIDYKFFTHVLRYVLARGKDRPTAFVCSNDLVAFILLRFLQEEGVRVPDDIAVTGYSNALPEYTEAMALTTVNQPFGELGRTAAGILIERIGHSTDERLRFPRDVKIPVELIIRRSSGSH